MEPFPLQEDAVMREMIEGKRIAYVGPANCIKGLRQGPEIDSYDVVIRVNRMPVHETLKIDYGRRCDVFFYGAPPPKKEELKISFEAYIRDFQPSIIYFIRRNPDPYYVKFIQDNFPSTHLAYMGVNFHEVVDHYRQGLHDTCSPLSGVLSLGAILFFGAKEIWMTGFDFYQNPVAYHELPDPRNYIQHNTKYEKQVRRFGKVKQYQGEHHIGPQIEVVKRFMQRYPKILRIDPILEEIFENWR